MAHWYKLSTAQVTERRSLSPASGTSFAMPTKRVTFDDRKYPFPNGRPRSAVPGQGNTRMSGSNLSRMGGPNPSSNRSMQGMRPDMWQRFNTTPRVSPAIPLYNVTLLLQPKRTVVRSAGEGCILIPIIVQPSMNHVSRVEDGVIFHVCVSCFRRRIRVSKTRRTDGAFRVPTDAD